MRILISSNAPYVHSGYGVQTGYIASGLRDLGHQVAIHAFYGLNGGLITWEGFPIYPAGLAAYGQDVLPMHARHFQADVVITLIDVWVLDERLPERLGESILWTPLAPIDHEPVPEVVLSRLRKAHRVLAYSRWGYDRLYALGLPVSYVPHAVDCRAFQPRDKAEARRRFGLDPAHYVVGMVAANQDFPPRKCFDLAFQAFARFRAEHPDSKLFCYSWPGTEMGGVDLVRLAHQFGLDNDVILVAPYTLLMGLKAEDMSYLYSTFDVFLNPARGEGFGVPIVEAQACGVPVITTDFSAMPELTASGWKVPVGERLLTGLYAYQGLPSVEGIYRRLEEAYACDRQAESRKAREFALSYDCARVMETYWTPVLEELESDLRRRRQGEERASG